MALKKGKPKRLSSGRKPNQFRDSDDPRAWSFRLEVRGNNFVELKAAVQEVLNKLNTCTNYKEMEFYTNRESWLLGAMYCPGPSVSFTLTTPLTFRIAQLRKQADELEKELGYRE